MAATVGTAALRLFLSDLVMGVAALGHPAIDSVLQPSKQVPNTAIRIAWAKRILGYAVDFTLGIFMKSGEPW